MSRYHLQRDIYFLLLPFRTVAQPAVDGKPPRFAFKTQPLRLEACDQSPAAERLLAELEAFMAYNRGHSTRLLHRGSHHDRADEMLGAYPTRLWRCFLAAAKAFAASGTTPKTEWLRALFDVPVTVDLDPWYGILSEHISTECRRLMAPVKAKAPATFMRDSLRRVNGGFELNVNLNEIGLTAEKTIVLSSQVQTCVPVIATVVDCLSRLQKVISRELESFVGQYERDELFTPAMRKAKELDHVQRLVVNFRRNHSSADRKLLREHQHLLLKALSD